MQPDLPLSRRFIDLHPPPGPLLMVGVTGSHHYGFPSPDSDIDLKGIHAVPTDQLLGLWPNTNPHDRLEVFEGTECDLTTHEVAQALKLMLKGNGNILERIFSPFQVVDSPYVEELRTLAKGAISRKVAGHYKGYLRGMQREHLAQDPPQAKSLLYTFRVALTGTHLLQTGEVHATLTDHLGSRPEFSQVNELISFKVHSTEKGVPPQALVDSIRGLWPTLEAMLLDAETNSGLPAEPQNVNQIDDWLRQLRRTL